MTYTYNVPLYSQTSYVQYVNPYDGNNGYRYRSRMVYECLYRVGIYDGYEYFYQYDPTTDTRYYKCVNIYSGERYIFNLMTGNWDVEFTPVYYTKYTTPTTTNNDIDFSWDIESMSTEDLKSLQTKISNEINRREPTKTTTTTSYHVDFGYVPEGFSRQSMYDVQSAVQSVTNTSTNSIMSLPQKINSPEYKEYNEAIDHMMNDIATYGLVDTFNVHSKIDYRLSGALLGNGTIYGIDGSVIESNILLRETRDFMTDRLVYDTGKEVWFTNRPAGFMHVSGDIYRYYEDLDESARRYPDEGFDTFLDKIPLFKAIYGDNGGVIGFKAIPVTNEMLDKYPSSNNEFVSEITKER